jgi:gas vesicle protein
LPWIFHSINEEHFMKDDKGWSKRDVGEGLAGLVAGLVVAGLFALFARNSSNDAHEADMRTLRTNNRSLDETIAELRGLINTLRAQNGNLAEQIARGRALVERVQREFSQNKNEYDQLKTYVETLRNEIHNAERSMGSGHNP